ncbi:diaminopimelate decarboxylase [Mesorhizobium erdmanii]|uniref:Diaminopimelate decarboxylase n=2 Tax=Mesorhizobium TaxID=68287 RepID=A0A3M9X219_9HYPH|nr:MULTISPECIES: diaminopimelate decarboxylase [Mesorhizobium]RNJ41782.1 diaminopimelate decarboxylase [Mesorhizobium japonicum]RXT42879.1 diaminopimelate decarboxylase [Mesorhizobium erdmanii]
MATAMIDAPHGDTGSKQLAYRNQALHMERVCIDTVATAVPTPFYCYSSDAIRTAYLTLSAALKPSGVSVCFAVKANGNLSVLGVLAALGSGMDIVSGGELERAVSAGVPASKIIFSGVGKRRSEIASALEVGIHQINIESEAELDAVIDVAGALGVRAPVALRVNPDVDAGTHAKISTGKKHDKFGIPFEDIPALYAKALTAPELDPVGLAVHIGSQILDLSPYRAAYSRIADLVRLLRSQGMAVRRLDLGGGIGIPYDQGRSPDLGEYATIVRETVSGLDCELTVEPGRWLVGPAGILVAEVLYIKKTADRLTAIVDAGMNDLMRPAMYGAVHPVFPVKQVRQSLHTYQIAGPVCESSDIFGTYEDLPLLRSGDRLAFGCAGAYGASMASTYNARDLAAEVLVDGDRFRVIRRRQTTEALLTLEEETEWQGSCVQSATDLRHEWKEI